MSHLLLTTWILIAALAQGAGRESSILELPEIDAYLRESRNRTREAGSEVNWVSRAAEIWTAYRVRQDMSADLHEYAVITGDQETSISGAFVAKLLSGEVLGKRTPPRIVIADAVVDGDVDLISRQISVDATFVRCRFENLKLRHSRWDRQLSVINSLVEGSMDMMSAVADDIFLSGTTFHGRAVFTGARIRMLGAVNALFMDKAVFNTAHISDNLLLTSASFRDDMDAVAIDVANTVDVVATKALNPHGAFTFHAAKIGRFLGYRSSYWGSADFHRAKIDGNFDFDDAIFLSTSNEANFKGVDAGAAFFQRTRFDGPVAFTDARFRLLTLIDVHWPSPSPAVRFEGATYTRLIVGGEDKWPRFIEGFLPQTVLNASVYAQLEEFLKRQGRTDDADSVYVAFKRRNQRESMKWYTAAWWWSSFKDVAVRHGRSPARAFAWSFLLIAVGYFVFRRPGGMEVKDPKDNGLRYNAWWYSLDSFAPVIDLDVGKRWRPRDGRRMAGNYLVLHRIAGWLLVPIGLAALAGILK